MFWLSTLGHFFASAFCFLVFLVFLVLLGISGTSGGTGLDDDILIESYYENRVPAYNDSGDASKSENSEPENLRYSAIALEIKYPSMTRNWILNFLGLVLYSLGCPAFDVCAFLITAFFIVYLNNWQNEESRRKAFIDRIAEDGLCRKSMEIIDTFSEELDQREKKVSESEEKLKHRKHAFGKEKKREINRNTQINNLQIKLEETEAEFKETRSDLKWTKGEMNRMKLEHDSDGEWFDKQMKDKDEFHSRKMEQQEKEWAKAVEEAVEEARVNLHKSHSELQINEQARMESKIEEGNKRNKEEMEKLRKETEEERRRTREVVSMTRGWFIWVIALMTLFVVVNGDRFYLLLLLVITFTVLCVGFPFFV